MLEARAVTFGYESNARPILDGVSIALEPGQRLFLSAPSGTGKTTLCRLLAGYERPWSGEVLLDGAPLPKRGCCPVQLIGQHPERVLDPRRRMRDSLEEAGWDGRLDAAGGLLERLGIQERWLTRFPHELSGGELQRFCIARALLVDARYLIADEISTMLDAITQARIWQVLLEEAASRDLGILFTTHAGPLADKIATCRTTL